MSYNHFFKSVRELIRFEFSSMCAICQKEISTEIHHINRNTQDNSHDNLIPLCKGCHKLAHKNGLKTMFRPYTQRSEEIAEHFRGIL